MVQDEAGRCLVAFARHVPFAFSELLMEAEACRVGCLIAIHQGWSDCILESDCAAVVSALGGQVVDLFEFGKVIEDCKKYMGALGSL